jgi:hypothetical protein
MRTMTEGMRANQSDLGEKNERQIEEQAENQPSMRAARKQTKL